jgi:hypothetical protein
MFSRGQQHSGLKCRTSTTENALASATFWEFPGQSFKEPFDFDAMDADDNESDLWGGMPSTYSEMSSEYQESIFDASSLRSSSLERPISVQHPRHRRMMTAWGRTQYGAVRAVEACWRCKFLRKRVSTNLSTRKLL